MNVYLQAITATAIVSLVSLVGIFTLAVNKKLLDKTLLLLIGFAAGSLMGGAFLHLLPEALEHNAAAGVFFYCLLGFVFFFIMERYLHWRHCHNGVCDVHMFTYLNLIGDGIHNFTDGLIIGISFLVDARFGVITTMVVLFHEIPQEIGDFAVLVYGGFSRAKALVYNFLCAAMAIVGAVLGCYLGNYADKMADILVPLTAGGFIYISACDLIPELHKQKSEKRANFSLVMFLLGLVFLWGMKAISYRH